MIDSWSRGLWTELGLTELHSPGSWGEGGDSVTGDSGGFADNELYGSLLVGYELTIG